MIPTNQSSEMIYELLDMPGVIGHEIAVKRPAEILSLSNESIFFSIDTIVKFSRDAGIR